MLEITDSTEPYIYYAFFYAHISSHLKEALYDFSLHIRIASITMLVLWGTSKIRVPWVQALQSWEIQSD